MGPHRVFFAGLTYLHRRGDTVRVLLTIDQLMPEADVSSQLFRSLLEQGLQPNLRQVGGAERARRDKVWIGIAAAPNLEPSKAPTIAVVRTGNTRIPCRGLHIFRRGALFENSVGYSDFFKDLQRALIEHVRLGEQGCVGQRGHEDVPNFKLRQQH